MSEFPEKTEIKSKKEEKGFQNYIIFVVGSRGDDEPVSEEEIEKFASQIEENKDKQNINIVSNVPVRISHARVERETGDLKGSTTIRVVSSDEEEENGDGGERRGWATTDGTPNGITNDITEELNE
jgi:hypothetical protein